MKPTRKRVIVDENVAQRNLRDAKRPQTRQALKAIEAAAEQQKKVVLIIQSSS
jgi:hypothetical protein